MSFPGTPGAAVPVDGMTRIVREIEDIKRQLREIGPLLVANGQLKLADPVTGQTVLYVGPTVIPDGSGRQQRVVFMARDDGTAAIQLGDLGTTPGHTHQQAAQWFDRTGNVVLADDTTSGQGIARPYIPIGQWVSQGQPIDTTTSSTFVTLQSLVGYRQHPQLAAQALVESSDSATTGEVRIVDQANNVVGPVQTVAGNYFGYVNFTVTAMVGAHESGLVLSLQGRRTAGTGTIGAAGTQAYGVQS